MTANLRILIQVKVQFLKTRTWLIYTGQLDLIFITAVLREIQSVGDRDTLSNNLQKITELLVRRTLTPYGIFAGIRLDAIKLREAILQGHCNV